MSGIAGIFKTEGGGINQGVLDNMTDLMVHRGPGDRGTWCDNYIGLGHRQLSLIEMDSGKQPFSDPSGRYTLVFDGEIYNYRQLHTELEKLGHTFRTESEAEVLLYYFIETGERGLEKINGMFAFALWDAEQQRLFLARDKMGTKPLYYARAGTAWLFASEIKSILAYPGFDSELNYKVLGFYLSNHHSVMGEETLFKGVQSLLPGYSMVITPNKCIRRRYWILPIIPESEKEDKGEDYYIAYLRDILTTVVKRRVTDGAESGVYLSGGLDSAILVSLLSEISEKPVKTFTVGFQDDGFNEFYYSDLVADIYGTDHTQIIVEAEDYFSTMKNLIRFKDAPLSLPNEVPMFLMSKVVKDSVPAVFSGEGSDGLFAGHGMLLRSPFDYLRSLQDSDVPISQRKLLNKALNRLYGRTEFAGELDHFMQIYSRMKQAEFEAIFNHEVFTDNHGFTGIEDFWRRKFAPLKNLDLYNKYLYSMESVHLPDLLKRLDSTTMAASVIGRTPFTDPDIVDFVSQIPWKYKLHWNSSFYESICSRLNASEIAETMDTTKYILKRSFVDKLPPDISFRKKHFLTVPITKWIDNGLMNEMIENAMDCCPDFLNREGLIRWMTEINDPEKDMKIWMLLSLITWYNEYFKNAEHNVEISYASTMVII